MSWEIFIGLAIHFVFMAWYIEWRNNQYYKKHTQRREREHEVIHEMVRNINRRLEDIK